MHGHCPPVNSSPTPPRPSTPAAGSALGAALHAALASLLPAVTYLPITLPSLNERGRWAPKKDHGSGRLLRGKLQLAAGTVVVLDECCMDAGEMNEMGITNLRVRMCGGRAGTGRGRGGAMGWLLHGWQGRWAKRASHSCGCMCGGCFVEGTWSGMAGSGDESN